MSDRSVRPGDLGMTRLLRLLAVLAVVFLAVLAIAPAKSHFSAWRAAQHRYNDLAAAEGASAMEPAIQQIWKPRMGIVDRCTSCHLGMGAAEPLAGDRLFCAHPVTPHDSADIGCTVCHGGQGRATSKDEAHGFVAHWESPLLDRRDFEAGCGSCHTHLPVPSATAAARGEALFRRYDCLACHRVNGAGRGTAPDLSWAGIRGFREDWQARHMAILQAAGGTERELWRESFGPMPEGEVAVITQFLKSLVGAPKLMRGKALAHQLGCRGCHRINGVGGDDGPDLSAEGRKVEADLPYAGVRGAHNLRTWLLEHFEDPARVVPGSLMPALGLSPEENESLTLYMLSLRAVDIPEAFWPKDRVRALRLGEREFASDGESLFGVFCAGCHGERGVGRRFGATVFPAIGNPDFLAVAPDDYLTKTITHGRPGRRMPAWGEGDGGLRPEEIEEIVRWIRSLAPGTPEPFTVTLPAGSAARGAALWERHCAGCHGATGTGGEAPALANPGFQAAATDTYIAATVLRGRAGTSMRHFGQPTYNFPTLDPQEVADIVAWIRRLGADAARQGR